MNRFPTNIFLRLIIAAFIIAIPFLQLSELTRGKETVYIGVIALELLLLLFHLCQSRKCVVRISAPDIWAFVWFVYIGIRFWVSGVDKVDPVVILGWTLLFISYLLFRQFKNCKWFLWAFVISGIIEAVMAWMQYKGLMVNQNTIFSATGSFRNPGPLGCYLSLVWVIAMSLLIESWNKSRFYLVGLLSAVSLFILFFLIKSDSRTGWMAATIGSIYIILHQPLLRDKIRTFLKNKWVAGICIGVLSVLAVAFWNYKSDSASGRLLIWRVSMDMIADKPLFGHGLGSFPDRYMFAQADYFAKHPDSKFTFVADNTYYPFNELVGLGVEQGLVSVFMVIGLIISLLYRSSRTLPPVYKAGLLSWLIIALFSYPLLTLPLLVLFAFFSSSLTTLSVYSIRINSVIKWFSVFVLAIFVCFISIFFFRCIRQKQSIAWFDQERLYISQITWDYIIRHDYERLRQIEQAAQMIPSVELYYSLGEMYVHQNEYEKAERCFKLALNMVPSRIYPRYCLFKLFRDSGNTDLATKYANDIMALRIKVENTLTIRIVAEVRKYLSSSDQY